MGAPLYALLSLRLPAQRSSPAELELLTVCLMHCWLLQRRSPTSHKEAGEGAGGLVNEARAAALLVAAVAPGAVVSLPVLCCFSLTDDCRYAVLHLPC